MLCCAACSSNEHSSAELLITEKGKWLLSTRGVSEHCRNRQSAFSGQNAHRVDRLHCSQVQRAHVRGSSLPSAQSTTVTDQHQSISTACMPCAALEIFCNSVPQDGGLFHTVSCIPEWKSCNARQWGWLVLAMRAKNEWFNPIRLTAKRFLCPVLLKPTTDPHADKTNKHT